MSPKAILWREFRKDYWDGTFVELMIWAVPYSKDHPYGLKYRLHFGARDGTCIVRYDNKRGKGDHRHIGEREEPYLFSTPEKLLEDFWTDIDKYRNKWR